MSAAWRTRSRSTRPDDSGPPRRPGRLPLRIARSAVPIYLAVIATTIGATVDAAVLGRYDTTALARFTAAMAVFIPAVTMVTGAQRGVVPVLAQAVGDAALLRRRLRDAMWLAVSVSAVGAAAVLCTRVVGGLVGAADVVAQVPVPLLVLLAASVVLTAVQATGSAMAIALDRAGLVFRAGVLATAVGVAGTLLLVRGPGPFPSLGLLGTGWAMFASTAVYAVGVHIAVARAGGLGVAALRLGWPDAGAIFDLARVGIPLAGTVLVKFAVLGVVALAATRQGIEAAAAYAVALSLANLTFSAAVAIGQAVVPHVARASSVPGARAPVVAGAQVAVAMVGLVSAIVLVARDHIIGVFTSDPAVARVVIDLLPIVGLAVLADAIQAVSGFGLVGLQRASASFAAFAVVYGALALIVVPIADAGGIARLWLALAVANALLVVAQSTLFARISATSDART